MPTNCSPPPTHTVECSYGRLSWCGGPPPHTALATSLTSGRWCLAISSTHRPGNGHRMEDVPEGGGLAEHPVPLEKGKWLIHFTARRLLICCLPSASPLPPSQLPDSRDYQPEGPSTLRESKTNMPDTCHHRSAARGLTVAHCPQQGMIKKVTGVSGGEMETTRKGPVSADVADGGAGVSVASLGHDGLEGHVHPAQAGGGGGWCTFQHAEASPRKVQDSVLLDLRPGPRVPAACGTEFPHTEGDPDAETWVNEKARRILNGQTSTVTTGIRRKATYLNLPPPSAPSPTGAPTTCSTGATTSASSPTAGSSPREHRRCRAVTSRHRVATG